MSDQRTICTLQEERVRHAELGDILDLHLAVLQARARFDAVAGEQRVDVEQARTRLNRGQPVLDAPALELDWTAFAALAQEIWEVTGRHQSITADSLSEFSNLCAADWRELARDYMARSQHPRLSTATAPVANLQGFVVNNALHPFLSRAETQARLLVEDAAWERAFCPLCGGVADFAALEKASGARRLLCSRCDCTWTFDRAACSYCGTDRQVGYFPVGQGAYRLYVCEVCKHYIKTVDLRELAREVDLPAERVLTLGLDVAALNAGYSNTNT